ncbi:putative FAD dependent oxidoreductase [Seiridium cardinale]
MKSRGSEKIMRTSLEGWPEGKRAPLDHGEVSAYLRQTAKDYQVEEKIRFGTRLESMSKKRNDNAWCVQTSSLVATSTSYTLKRECWNFDVVVVVVVSGRYGAPRVPDIPGLSLETKFPQPE